MRRKTAEIQLKFEEFTLPPGCREAHKVPDSECHKCNWDTQDHTVKFSFPVPDRGARDSVAYKKVCLKDYLKLYPEQKNKVIQKGG